MDQNFIRAAFMSLDDIEKVENKVIKQALKESREKEKQIRIMGDPGKGVEIFNRNMQIGDGSSAIEEDFDVDELANKYIGQIVSIKPTYSKFKNYIGEITNIVQFNKTFEDSV